MTTEEFKPDYLIPGTRIASYIVRTQLGRGGSGTVYEVQSSEGNLFALKICRYKPGPHGTTDWRMDRRFTRSVVCLEQLKRVRNVAEIFGHDRYPDPLTGFQYLIQELVPGSLTITGWVKRQSPSLLKIVTAFQELAELCAELTHAGIRHRDLKPDNILMAPGDIPKVIDFDSAICPRAESLTRRTAIAQPCTRGHYSPELCRAILDEQQTGEKRVFDYSPGSDLHALGVVFYECLTGEHPFDLSLPDDHLLSEVAYENPLHPMSLNPAVPFGLNKVVMRLLEKDPLRRYQHGDHLAADLRTLLEKVADESWTTPFQLPDLEEATPIPQSRVTALTLRAVEVSTPKEAPKPTPLPERSVSEHAAGRLLLVAHAQTRPNRWHRVRFAVVLGVAFVVGLVGALWWPETAPLRMTAFEAGILASATCGPVKGATVPLLNSDPSPPTPKVKRTKRRARNAAVMAAATVACASCATMKVRPEDDLAWLANCPSEARETVRLLGIHTEEHVPNDARLMKGPNVIPHERGCEVREGEVRAAATMHPYRASGMLIGTVREGTDRVSIRFHELVMADGRKLPICALGATDFWGHGPGIAKAEDPPPVSKRNPSFIFITHETIPIRIAPYVLPRRS